MTMIKSDIKSMLLSELETYFLSIGEPKFRAKQVFGWIHGGASRFDEMLNISKPLRQKLDAEFYINAPTLITLSTSQANETTKFLWQMHDSATIESVLMQYAYGNTVCISSQVGCAMGCAFCASAIGGLERNLNASEMLNQVFFSQKESGKKISNVVIMGIGEPLDNFENVIRFLKLINHPAGLKMSLRKVTISTCGIIENIDKLADYKIQSTLTVSLHAPDDETRSRLMPINRKYGVDRLLEACNRYFSKTGRRVSYEYSMIDGVNDTSAHAELLARKLKCSGSHVNIIPLSDVPERLLKGSSTEKIKAFLKILNHCNINATVRRSLGQDISASCGQLRVRHIEKGS
ncbi:MAG: 23S rRNA (adenine(2503)-C(2))-methyltransferase RlmN [Oscillospiraceae bacterium]|nr:23S rRNA (adenine(2503)-C(2))-methyltransferase RlmN [Oscillospiraceae bacterium]